MTFILISSSGTMAMAVSSAYKKQRVRTGVLILLTALGGLSFVGMQAFEWTKLIVDEGIRPWGNDFGAQQFGSFFFMITGFHGLHVSIGVIYLSIVAKRVLNGRYDRLDDYQIVEVGRSLLALCGPGVGLYFCILLFMVRSDYGTTF
jgi:cytochrome c oxidase subunit 3